MEFAFRQFQKTTRHSRQEIEDACWELVTEWESQAQGDEKEYLHQRLQTVRHRLPIRTFGAGWNKVQEIHHSISMFCTGTSIWKAMDSKINAFGKFGYCL